MWWILTAVALIRVLAFSFSPLSRPRRGGGSCGSGSCLRATPPPACRTVHRPWPMAPPPRTPQCPWQKMQRHVKAHATAQAHDDARHINSRVSKACAAVVEIHSGWCGARLTFRARATAPEAVVAPTASAAFTTAANLSDERMESTHGGHIPWSHDHEAEHSREPMGKVR